MKTTRLSEKLVLKKFKFNNNKVINSSDNRTNKTVINLSKNNKFRKLIYISNIIAIKKSIFLIPNAKKAFNYLR